MESVKVIFSLDDRTGNIVTTVALFAVAAVIIYKARGAFFILVLSLFFAYLLESAVTLVQRYSRLGHKNRTWAIAQMYLIGTLVVGGVGYAVRSAPGSANEEPERGCARDLGGGFPVAGLVIRMRGYGTG